MALLQCMDFFKKYPKIKLVEDKDTQARRIQEKQLGIAAIASVTASECMIWKFWRQEFRR
jgi:prephenate dehydratase